MYILQPKQSKIYEISCLNLKTQHKPSHEDSTDTKKRQVSQNHSFYSILQQLCSTWKTIKK